MKGYTVNHRMGLICCFDLLPQISVWAAPTPTGLESLIQTRPSCWACGGGRFTYLGDFLNAGADLKRQGKFHPSQQVWFPSHLDGRLKQPFTDRWWERNGAALHMACCCVEGAGSSLLCAAISFGSWLPTNLVGME